MDDFSHLVGRVLAGVIIGCAVWGVVRLLGAPGRAKVRAAERMAAQAIRDLERDRS